MIFETDNSPVAWSLIKFEKIIITELTLLTRVAALTRLTTFYKKNLGKNKQNRIDIGRFQRS